jgi:hypothetical protein
MRLLATNVKVYEPHLRLFSLVSAGRALADVAFERDEVAAHARVYVQMLRALSIRPARIEVSDTRATLALLESAGLSRDDVRANVRAHAPTSGRDLLASRGVVLPSIDEPRDLDALAIDDEQRSRLARLLSATLKPLERALEVPVRLDLARLQGLDYYDGLRVSIFVGDAAGEAAVGDGGVVSWTQTILGDRKERLVTSGIGVEYLAARFLAE